MLSLALLTLPALAVAQSFDFNVINSQPAPIVQSAPLSNAASDSPALQSLSAIPAIAKFIIDQAPIAQSKRDTIAENLFKRDGDCSVQPAGTGPTVNNPDTPQAFEKYFPFAQAALSAPIPFGYALNFTNWNSSNSQAGYMGYTQFNSYDTRSCAAQCNKIDGCVAFNIYFERDPSLDPNAVSCPNPPSVTNIKCVFWGTPVSKTTATNNGQYRDQFQVVIAGSNGYNMIPIPAAVSGFTAASSAYKGQLSIPSDPTNAYNTYIGSKFISFGAADSKSATQYYSAEICASACADQTAYNFAHPPSTGNPTVCNQVVGHSLSKNGVPQGMYCAFYSESWDYSYGTTTFVANAGDAWAVGYTFSYTNATYAASYSNISPKGYKGGNCGGWGGKC